MIRHIIDNIYISDWADAKRYRKEFETFTVARECERLFIGDHFYPLIDKVDKNNELILSAAISGLIVARSRTQHKILVHCEYGRSRSVAVVLGYMIFRWHFSFDDALEYIKNCKREDLPLNPYFKELLWRIEDSRKVFEET